MSDKRVRHRPELQGLMYDLYKGSFPSDAKKQARGIHILGNGVSWKSSNGIESATPHGITRASAPSDTNGIPGHFAYVPNNVLALRQWILLRNVVE